MRIRRAFALALLLALATATTACGEGSNSNNQIATAGGATPSPSGSAGSASGDEKELMLKYAKCMRENGLPDFPDPEFQEGGGVSLVVPQGADRAKFEAAEAKCKQYLPNGGEPQKPDPQQAEAMRKYAQCMRDNGLPDFPDPTDEGGIEIDGNNPDMAPDSPKMKAAEEKCRQHLPKGPDGESGGTHSEKLDG